MRNPSNGAPSGDPRTVLITGCSSGIGYDAARALKARGWRVFASCRQEADCARLRAAGFESPRLDYEDAASVRDAVDAALEATGGRLDAVFNNGAFASPGALEDMPTDGLRAIFEANFFGWHELSRRALPAMRRQGFGRLVNCSSVLGFVTLKYRGAYQATKFAIEGYTDTLRLELAGSGVHAILIAPGPIRTKFRANAYPHFQRWIRWEGSAHADVYPEIDARLAAKEDAKSRFELGPEAVTKKLIHALESDRPAARYYVTTATYLMAFAKRLLPTRALDRLLSSQSY